MLQHLSIKNYALIDYLSIDFSNGFTVVTGETGSGKSIMLGAIGLILGERADLKSLRNKEEKCVIEGFFKLSKIKYETFFKDNELDFDEETILRREITPSGKSRAFINDTPVTISVLKQLGEDVVDIHSQHETQRLNTLDFQNEVLDVAIDGLSILEEYKELFKAYNTIQKQIDETVALEQQANSEQDYLTFQLEELSKLDLALDKNELEQEYSLLSNAEDVIRITNDANSIISNDEAGIVLALKQLEQTIIKLQKISPFYNELSQRVKSVIIELQDIDFEISERVSKLEMDEDRLTLLDELLGEINRLEKKYNVISLSELKSLKESLMLKSVDFSNLSEKIKELEKVAKEKLAKLTSKGKELTALRQKGTAILEAKVMNTLKDLAMPNAVLKVELTPSSTPLRQGFETVNFLISTNKGTAFEPLKKVASGGELSRIMLAIKMILAEKGTLGTLIFDEIDTGVSGEVANRMGEIMQLMATKMQIVSITHLPQIASKGTAHIRVYKKDEGNLTNTYIEVLNKEERLIEIAKMLSGNTPTTAALNNAKELLN